MSRAPRGPLRLFVSRVWSHEGQARPDGFARERVLPSGAMHVVLRLAEEPLRIYRDASDERGEAHGTAVVGGARTQFYLRDVSRPSCSVGAMLGPGAALALFGVAAHELAGTHTPLESIWGSEVDRIRARLLAAPDPEARLAVFEAELTARLPRVRGVHPAIAHAIARFDAGAPDVATIVRETGYSHRRLVTLFGESVGLTPKRYCRIRRLERVLPLLRAAGPSLSGAALEAGYSDQAHMCRELRDLAGTTPSQLARLERRHALHVPVVPSSDPFKTRSAPEARLDP